MSPCARAEHCSVPTGALRWAGRGRGRRSKQRAIERDEDRWLGAWSDGSSPWPFPLGGDRARARRRRPAGVSRPFRPAWVSETTRRSPMAGALLPYTLPDDQLLVRLPEPEPNAGWRPHLLSRLATPVPKVRPRLPVRRHSASPCAQGNHCSVSTGAPRRAGRDRGRRSVCRRTRRRSFLSRAYCHLLSVSRAAIEASRHGSTRAENNARANAKPRIE